MAFVTREKLFSKKWFRTYAGILIGSIIMAAGYSFFISPYRIVPGGVYGISIVVHYVTEGLFAFAPDGFPIGLFGLILNIPLTILGIRLLGPRFGVKTVVGFFLVSVFIDLFTYLAGSDPLRIGEDVLLASVFGGLLIGFGLGLIFRARATTGGSDIVAMIFAKYSRMPLGQLIIIIDSVIVLVGLAVFKDWRIPLYSWITIFVTGKVIDIVVEGMSYEKSLLIVSEKHEQIKDKILVDLNRGGTYLAGNGLYSGVDRRIIFTVVTRRELAILQDFISEIDPEAFMTVNDSTEVLGKGFRSLKDKVQQY
ncbi:MAG: YitT family protein [Bacteroidales bacterium]|nr:YitT family protein [Bacteroidales bacterium]MDD3010978.1 YitT family protein [Bacteroidales bacterium]MDD3961116.1 YitT family protein [Bacteroidales bacterium]MDY0284931.1 YitT family protein [Bacteroidales bacterium]HPE85903.1 YitT family protein [Bacteroidales bacterium]